MKELMVVAIGGNSIIKDNASQSIEHQAQAVKAVAESVLEMLASDYDIVLTHGNGPQVGLDLRRAEIAHEREGLPLTPLANCVADTQGGIGYLIQQALNNRLAARGEQKAVTVVTQVEVDKNDPGFAHPTKPIGAFFSEAQRDELQLAHPDWHFVEDSGRGYRRVVASPQPLRIVEADAIKTLTQKGFVVIGAGGGGIPVVRTEQGDYQSVDAVIDKDLSTALLAREIRADVLVITTGVEKVCINFGKPNQQALDTVSVAQMTRYKDEGHFPAGTSIQDMIRLEQKLLPELQPYTQERAEKLIDLIQSKGSTLARSHCNIEPTSGLKNLENLQAVLARRKPGFDCEIVAFPQHGLLLSNSEKLMREAMQAGAHYVGGLDPTNVDGAMEKSLDLMFQIALDYDKGVDIHLHETSPAGVAAVNYMVETVEKTPQLKGKLTISHAFALATLNEQQVDEIATRMAAQQVTIASTVPIGTLHMPLKQLRDKGVFVMTGTDSVIDHWSPYGLGDMLEKANLYAQLYIRPNEQTLSRALGIATGDVLPLNDKGERVWPKAQDDASFVLVDASCSAEAVARISPRTATFHKGNLVWGTVG